MVLRGGLDAVAKRKKSYHCTSRELNPGRPARSLVCLLTELTQLLIYIYIYIYIYIERERERGVCVRACA
jgi:hypothetical protein